MHKIHDIIIETVCNHFNINRENLSERRRKQKLVITRYIIIYLCRKYAPNISSHHKIIKLFNIKNHTTSIHAVKTIKNRLSYDKNFINEIKTIEQQIKNALNIS